MTKPTKKASRLLIRPGGIGDCITTFPVLERLRAGYTEIWTNASCIPLIDFADRARCALARGILVLPFPEHWSTVDLPHELCRFDEVISWYGLGVAGAIEGLRKLHPNVLVMPPLPPPDSEEHAVDFHLRAAGFAESAGCVPRVRQWTWTGTGEFIAFQPFASSAAKEWPLERYIELEAALSAQLPVRWFVNSRERPLPRVAGRLVEAPLDEVADQLTRAALYVGGDTGTSHLAGAIGVPSVVLFGHTRACIWKPRSQGPLRVLESETGRVDGIQTESVRTAAGKLLAGRWPQHPRQHPRVIRA